MSTHSGKLRPDSTCRQELRLGRDGAAICRPRDGDEFLSAENVRILESWNTEHDQAVSIARARLEKGQATEVHALIDTEERYLVVSGAGEVRIGSMDAEIVGAGDVVFIPSGVMQTIRNVGEQDLVFYCICTPPFRAANYRSLPDRSG